MVYKKVDSIVLFNFKNYWIHPLINKYLQTKETTSPSEHYEGILVLRKNKKPLWLSHPFNYKQAKSTFRNAEVKSYKTKKELQELLSKNCGKRVGFDARHTAVSTLKSLKKMLKGERMIDVSKEMEQLREVKTDEEIQRIRKAVEKTKEVLFRVKSQLKEGITEKDLYWKIKNYFEHEGMELGFCIVAFGKNTSNIHHVSGETKLKKENAVMIDTGAKYKGYYADITESYWFGKNEPIEFTKTVNKANEAIKRVEEKLKEGTIASELWKICNIKMPHALGHGLGIEEHDLPGGISEKSKWKLKQKMVLAIEPAIYTKKFGVRIEFDYLIKEKGFEKF
jgi:Xaa-Pro aminopeptidase